MDKMDTYDSSSAEDLTIDPQSLSVNYEQMRLYSSNLQHHLWDRERGINRRNYRRQPPSWHLDYERKFAKSITPNFTIQNVDKPIGYIRKFTPDGTMLVSFSRDQRCVEIYTYCGTARLASKMSSFSSEVITAADQSDETLRLRQCAYGDMLKLRWNINVTAPILSANARTHLNREFSIFFDDGHYVMVASVSLNLLHPPINHIFKYPDLYDECDLYMYTFYLIDLGRGMVTDILIMQQDNLSLSHNYSVSAYGRYFAVLSKYRQCVDLILITDEGKFKKLQTIGPRKVQEDQTMIDAEASEVRLPYSPLDELPLSFIKQRILASLYRDIWESTAVNVDVDSDEAVAAAIHLRREKLSHFFINFKRYERMIIVKAQLVNEDYMLIRYEERPVNSPAIDLKEFGGNSVPPADSDFKLYVFFNISREEVVRVYANDSYELLYMLRDYCDTFRNANTYYTKRPSPSPSNCMYFLADFNRVIESITGGPEEAPLKMNATLPVNTQNYTTSPYLDWTLFSYDDRWVSPMERPRLSNSQPIRFADRNTDVTLFRLFLEESNRSGSTDSPDDSNGSGSGGGTQTHPSHRDLCQFVFHPTEPFIISIQKLSTRFVMNFHIYNQATWVKP